MALNHEFYEARADEAAREAEATSLENVRRRALRSEAAWRDMADRARQVERDRETARIEREERIAQERAAGQ